MRRDLDLVRLILLAIEESAHDPRAYIEGLAIPNYSKKVISYHVMLLHEAELIVGEDLSVLTGSEDGYEWAPKYITWKGHEFLSSAKNESIWQKLKIKIGQNAGTLPFSIAQEVLVQLIKNDIMPTGIAE